MSNAWNVYEGSKWVDVFTYRDLAEECVREGMRNGRI